MSPNPKDSKQSRKQELAHEALQDRETVADYLRAIADGLESGKLNLAGEEFAMEFYPQHLIGFELDARRERGRSRIRMRLEWREDKPGEGAELKITAE